MNREILFRGKSISTRNWTYGFFLGPDSIFSEYYDQSTGSWDVDEVSIDPATLNQYTGLQDKNGVRIFDGDILQSVNGIAYVVWGGTGFALKSPGSEAVDWHPSPYYKTMEIIGNIHDNPELI